MIVYVFNWPVYANDENMKGIDIHFLFSLSIFYPPHFQAYDFDVKIL